MNSALSKSNKLLKSMPLLEAVVMESDSAFATSFAGVFVTHSAVGNKRLMKLNKAVCDQHAPT